MKPRAKGIVGWLVVVAGAACAVAQSAKPLPENAASTPVASRQEIEAYAATNKTFARAIEYFVATLDGRQPQKLPEGLTLEDVSRAALKAFPNAGAFLDAPIRFYGRVVDESNQPVSGAVIHLEWEGFLVRGKNAVELTSDRSGSFALTNKNGTQLYVSVEKTNYYASARNRGTGIFRYAAAYGEVWQPDPSQPALYYLHKKGEPAKSLVTSQYGMRSDLWVKAPLNGTKVNVNLLERKTGHGPLELSQVKPDFDTWKTATAWSFSMTLPGGGFIETSEEFPFHPPESGYQPEVQFRFEKSGTNWTTNLRREFYMKFGSPALYGHLRLETSISSSTAMLRYAINPDGSRNLEPKQ